MSRLAEPFLGRWRIDHMDDYDRDYLDLVEPAFIQFDRDGSGEFVFGAVTGQLDCRYDKAGVAFTWHGQDEMDEVSGRGCAERKIGQHNRWPSLSSSRRRFRIYSLQRVILPQPAKPLRDSILYLGKTTPTR